MMTLIRGEEGIDDVIGEEEGIDDDTHQRGGGDR